MTTEPINIHLAFDDELIELDTSNIIPVKIVSKAIKNSSKYKQIKSSINALGVIEPLVVKRESKKSKSYILLDGHLRLEALNQLNLSKAQCLLSSDDETYTYNKYINRIAPVQEHRMILKAIARGVSEEKIAGALNIDARSIAMKRDLLRGVCPEVAEMLKDKIIGYAVFQELRKMKAIRQIESVKLMESANNYTVNYAKMLLAATPKNQLIKVDKTKKIHGLSPDQVARMEAEMQQLQKEFRIVEEQYGEDILHHTLVKSYLRTLLKNTKINKYLERKHARAKSSIINSPYHQEHKEIKWRYLYQDQ